MKTSKPRLIRSKQIDLNLLRDRRIAIIGYGSQGRAQALNLRDSGFMPIIGLPSRSRSRRHAARDGFAVTTPSRACKQADIVVILIPDHKHKELFENELDKVLHRGQTYIFAHGLSVHFKLVRQPDGIDFVLVAPHGPGVRLRERYLEGKSLTAFVARTDKSSKQSLKLAAAYGKAIGCGGRGLMITDFASEAVGDIFGEQAVLCGGLSALLKVGFDTLVKAGLPPENAYLECIYQIDLIVDLIKKYGIDGMYDRISTTAAFGSVMAEPSIFDSHSRKNFRRMFEDIQTGKFVKELLADYENSFVKFKAARNKIKNPALDEMAIYFGDKV